MAASLSCVASLFFFEVAIEMIRERAGLTQDLLATKLQLCGCDITRSAVAKIEVGQRHLYPDEIILIKQILKTSYEEIFKID